VKNQLFAYFIVGVTSSVATVFLTMTLRAGAIVPPNVPDTVAYSGYLDLDGGPFDGMLDVSLHAYANAADDVAVYTWDLTDVSFSAGRFSVVLPLDDPSGEPNAAGALVRTDPSVYIGVDLHYGDAAVTLQGRQRLQAVPYAVSARHSTDFDVDGDLHVAGDVTFDQPLPAGVIGTDQLSTGAVTNAVIAADTVRADEIATDAVGLDELAGDEVSVFRGGPYCYKADRNTLTLDGGETCKSRQASTCNINIDGGTLPAPRYLTCEGDVDPCQLFNTPHDCTFIRAGYLVAEPVTPE